MNDLTERRLKMKQKRQRRKTKIVFFIALFLGSFLVFAFFQLYRLPELAKENHKKIASLENKVATLNSQLTEATSTLNQLKEQTAAEEEKKKPRMVFGQPNDGEHLPDLAEQIKTKLTAANYIGSILVIKDNQIVLEQGYGYADQKKDKLNTPNSEFLIASVQKSMTAVLIMTLIEEGQLTLETPLSAFYPTVPNSQSITIKDLLDMTSGLFSKGYDKNGYSEEDSINYALQNVTYQPLEKWRNSAVNYTLLAGIIRQLTGVSYEAYFTNKIIFPLNLTHTGFYQSYLSRSDRSLSSNNKFSPYQREVELADNRLSSETGTGNVYSSTGDMFTFLQALIDGKIIRQDSLALLWQTKEMPFSYNYAGGYYQLKDGIKGHGNFSGYESSLNLTTDGKTGVITLSNYILPSSKNLNMTAEIFKLLAD